MIKFLAVPVFFLIFTHFASADPQALPRLESVLLRTRLLEDTEDGVHALAFQIQNLEKELDVIAFSIDISSDPTRFSPNSPGVFFSEPHLSSSTQGNLLRIGQENLVRVGSPSAPKDWASVIDKSSRLRWGPITDSALLRPGESSEPFVVMFQGLLGIRAAYLDADLDRYLPVVDEVTVNIDSLFAEIDAATLQVYTIGPKAAPKTHDPALILTELLADTRRAREFGWVRTLEASQNVEDLMTLAQSQFAAGKLGQARSALEEAIEVVASEGCREWECPPERAFTSEARALLMIDLRYIVELLPSNSSPVANAGPDIQVECTTPGATLVTLDGTRSYDPDGDSISYLWSGSFGTETEPEPTVALGLGAHEIRLTVADDEFESEPAVVNAVVRVRAVGFDPPMDALVPQSSERRGSLPEFSAGRVIPLKLSLYCGAKRLGREDVRPPRLVTIGLVEASSAAAAPRAASLPRSLQDTPSLQEFRGSQNNWIYNLSTKHLEPGDYRAVIETPDGLRYGAEFSLH